MPLFPWLEQIPGTQFAPDLRKRLGLPLSPEQEEVLLKGAQRRAPSVGLPPAGNPPSPIEAIDGPGGPGAVWRGMGPLPQAPQPLAPPPPAGKATEVAPADPEAMAAQLRAYKKAASGPEPEFYKDVEAATPIRILRGAYGHSTALAGPGIPAGFEIPGFQGKAGYLQSLRDAREARGVNTLMAMTAADQARSAANADQAAKLEAARIQTEGQLKAAESQGRMITTAEQAKAIQASIDSGVSPDVAYARAAAAGDLSRKLEDARRGKEPEVVPGVVPEAKPSAVGKLRQEEETSKFAQKHGFEDVLDPETRTTKRNELKIDAALADLSRHPELLSDPKFLAMFSRGAGKRTPAQVREAVEQGMIRRAGATPIDGLTVEHRPATIGSGVGRKSILGPKGETLANYPYVWGPLGQYFSGVSNLGGRGANADAEAKAAAAILKSLYLKR